VPTVPLGGSRCESRRQSSRRGCAGRRFAVPLAFDNLRSKPLWKMLRPPRPSSDCCCRHCSWRLTKLYRDRCSGTPCRDVDALRGRRSLTAGASGLCRRWLNQGWLTRRFPTGAPEEEYELSAEALTALRFVTGLLKPRTTATESRLSVVIHQLSRLAEETNTSPEARMAALRAERDRIDRAIEEVERGGVKTLAPDRALERQRRSLPWRWN